MDWFIVDRMLLNSFERDTLCSLQMSHQLAATSWQLNSVAYKIVKKTTCLWSLHISPFRVFLFVSVSWLH